MRRRRERKRKEVDEKISTPSITCSRKTNEIMSNKVRKELLFLYKSAIKSVSGQKSISNILEITPEAVLRITPSPVICASPVVEEFDLKKRQLLVIGAGKSVLGLASGFLECLDSFNCSQPENKIRIANGILSIPFGIDVSSSMTLFEKFNVKLMSGAKHNIPDENSVKATECIVRLIDSLDEMDQKYLVVNFISGGGSALLSLPKVGIPLKRKRQIIDQLVKAGSTIEDLNKVRRVLSQVKGGKLLQRIKDPQKVVMVSLIASDIIGDPIDLIASGPTVPVEADAVNLALEVLKKRNLKLSPEESKILCKGENNEVKKSDAKNYIVVSNATALSELTSLASGKLNYEVIFIGNNIEGEASQVAVRLANFVRNYKSTKGKKLLFIGGGETTVTFDPELSRLGTGGRCQEMALAFFTESFSWNENITFMAVGTDGQDGPTPVAGVITNSGGIGFITRDEDASRLLADCSEGLKYHDSYNFWLKHDPDCLINIGGPTGVNVMDLYCFVKENENNSSKL